jgi:hypothetical protein
MVLFLYLPGSLIFILNDLRHKYQISAKKSSLKQFQITLNMCIICALLIVSHVHKHLHKNVQNKERKKWRNTEIHAKFTIRYLNAEKVREVKEINFVTEVKLSAVEWCQSYFFRHKRQAK